MTFEEWFESVYGETRPELALLKENLRMAWEAALRNQWQPIEVVEIRKVTHYIYSDTLLLIKANGEYDPITGYFCPIERKWVSTVDTRPLIEQPTHWMKLPKPPTE